MKILVLVSVFLVSFSACKKSDDSKNSDSSDESENSDTTDPDEEGSGEDGDIKVSGTLNISGADTILALPSNAGALIANSLTDIPEATIAEGEFNISIANSANLNSSANSHVVIAFAKQEDKFAEGDSIKFLNVPTNGEGAINLHTPALKGSIDLGEVSDGENDDLHATTTISSENMDLADEVISELAATDRVIKSIKNHYVNTDFGTGDSIKFQPKFYFDGKIEDVKNKANLPTNITYNSYSLGFDIDRSDFKLATVCDAGGSGFKTLKLVPPSAVETVDKLDKSGNVHTEGQTMTEFTNKNATATKAGSKEGRTECGQDNEPGRMFVFHDAPETRIGVAWAGIKGAIKPGNWNMILEDTKIGQFDIAAMSPLKDDTPIIYIPSLKMVAAENGRISGVEVTLHLYNFKTAAFEEIKDLSAFLKISTEFRFGVEDYSQSPPASDLVDLSANEDGTKFIGSTEKWGHNWTIDAADTDAILVPGVSIEYNLYGTYYRFEYR